MAYNYYQPYSSYAQQETAHRLQRMRDEINDQLVQMQQQPAPQIQQTFITPSIDNSQMNIPAKWVNSYDEVKAANVYVATIFMDKNKPRFYMKDENRDFVSCPATFTTYRFTDIYIRTNDAEPVIPSASFAIQQ